MMTVTFMICATAVYCLVNQASADVKSRLRAIRVTVSKHDRRGSVRQITK